MEETGRSKPNRGPIRISSLFLIFPWIPWVPWLFSAADVTAQEVDVPREYTYRVVNSYPHDPEAFTQGLIFHRGALYESTGGHRESRLRRVELETGRVLQEHRLADTLFAEGLALSGDRLVQLTWRAGRGLVYDADSLAPVGEFGYSGEGWGLAYDGQHLLMSDGTDVLRVLEPRGFGEVGRLQVTDRGRALTNLNELEYVEGSIYANVWHSDRIALISRATGAVQGWLDLSGLLPLAFRTDEIDVLNGIAYDAVGQRLFVTGKRWPRIFEIELVPVPR